jgi:hypothetical protein
MDEEKQTSLIDLYDDVYAVLFRYAMVTPLTMSMAIPSDFMQDVAQRSLIIRFAQEGQNEAGTRRADCEEIRKCFPAEVAILERRVGEHLHDYVIFKLAPAFVEEVLTDTTHL